MANYVYNYENTPTHTPPKMNTGRNMWKFMVFNILTLGIYSMFFFTPIAFDLDKIAPKDDRAKTFNYFFAFVLSYFTFSIVLDIWFYQITVRISEALEKRNIDYEFETGDFWKWFIFGSLILVGPFVYFHKFCKAMNLLCEDYNKDPVSK